MTNGSHKHKLSSLDKVTIILDYVGVFGNLVFLVTVIHKRVESKMTTLLLRHKTILDGMICILASIYIFKPFIWYTGIPVLDPVVCYLWHAQIFYWLFVFMNTQNMVLIAVDRFCAIVLAPKYKILCRPMKVGFFLLVYIASTMFITPLFFQISFVNGTCESTIDYETETIRVLLVAYAFTWFMAIYIVPTLIFITLYTMIANVLRKTWKANTSVANGQEGYVAATRQFTITTLIVTIVFVGLFSFDSIYYIIGYLLGKKEYNPNNDLIKLGMILISLNSMANPFIYFFLMKSVRNKVIGTLSYPFRRYCRRNEVNDTRAANVST